MAEEKIREEVKGKRVKTKLVRMRRKGVVDLKQRYENRGVWREREREKQGTQNDERTNGFVEI